MTINMDLRVIDESELTGVLCDTRVVMVISYGAWPVNDTLAVLLAELEIHHVGRICNIKFVCNTVI